MRLDEHDGLQTREQMLVGLAGGVDMDEATAYAERLAIQLHSKHYSDNLGWKPLSGDLIGILTQIDNMTSGLGIIPNSLPSSPVSELVERLEKLAKWADESQHEKWCGRKEVPVHGFSGEGILIREAASALTTLSTRNAELEREVKRLREALEFYADTSKYPAPFTGGFGELYYDCGQIARRALSTSPQGGEHE